MGNEVLEFAAAIGARDLKSCLEGTKLQGLFRGRNYFLLDKSTYLIVKTSPGGKEEFWGLGKDFVGVFDLLTRKEGNYFFVALASNRSGWVLSRRQLAAMIADGSLGFSEDHLEYRLESPNLKDSDRFESIAAFLGKIAPTPETAPAPLPRPGSR
ncbi:MAG: hypothetical protein JXP48_03855 [Acidobacteria bacterium]|nr:hypothetical protein [Acidobacteriota bacterium]